MFECWSALGLLFCRKDSERVSKRVTRKGDQRRKCDHNLREKVIEEDLEEDGLECFS